LLRLREPIEKGAVEVGIGRKAQAQEAVKQYQGEAQQAVVPKDPLACGDRFAGQEALALTLVAAVVADIQEEAPEEHGPKGVVHPVA